MRRAVVAALAALLGACSNGQYACENDVQCANGEDAGFCEASGYCSFEDRACPSGRRYGEFAGGGLAELCVVEASQATDGGTSQSSDDGGSSTTGDPSTTGVPPFTTSPGSSSLSSPPSEDSSTTLPVPSDSGDGSSSGSEDLPALLGEPCVSDDGCESQRCNIVPSLGGVCSECVDDGDCGGGGCTPPGIAGEQLTPAVCNDGELGAGCDLTSSCQEGLRCVDVYEVPQAYVARGCSTCIDDADCGTNEVCEPTIDLSNTHAYKSCVGVYSRPAGAFCDLNAVHAPGDTPCGPGFCAAGSVDGLYELGVCGVCTASSGCGSGTCIPPIVGGPGQENTPSSCG